MLNLHRNKDKNAEFQHLNHLLTEANLKTSKYATTCTQSVASDHQSQKMTNQENTKYKKIMTHNSQYKPPRKFHKRRNLNATIKHSN